MTEKILKQLESVPFIFNDSEMQEVRKEIFFRRMHSDVLLFCNRTSNGFWWFPNFNNSLLLRTTMLHESKIEALKVSLNNYVCYGHCKM